MHTGRFRRIALIFFLVAFALGTPSLAQTNLTGEWRPLFHEDVGHRLDARAAGGPDTPSGTGGPAIGDYTGLPLNDAGRLKAESWDPRLIEAREHQTIVAPGAYWLLGAGSLRITNVIDDATQQLVAIKIYRAGPAGTSTRVIWMDGHAAPPLYAAHTWWGFSTGEWSGSVLAVHTTHLKAGWIRRNGAPASDAATMTEYFARHGSYLTLTRILDDPVYLEEPLVTTVSWLLEPQQQPAPPPADGIIDMPDRPEVFVPHFLPGANPFLRDYAKKYGLPFEATRGGSETTYPEYARKLRTSATKPSTQ
jgi:hypothetical protein